MTDTVNLVLGVVGLIGGIITIFRPRWLKKFWKIRITYENFGKNIAGYYYISLGLLISGTCLWLTISSLRSLIGPNW
jgi:hypothetical protein